MIIRKAKAEDLEAIVRIYNQAIEARKFTADIEKIEISSRMRWFKEHCEDKYPIFVSEIDGKVCGWISLSPYRSGREALRFTAEVSYYVDFDYQKRGIGTKLLGYVIKECSQYKIKTIFAIVLEWNSVSIHLLKKFNFKKWGFLPRIADFDGEECGHVYYGLRIGE